MTREIGTLEAAAAEAAAQAAAEVQAAGRGRRRAQPATRPVTVFVPDEPAEPLEDPDDYDDPYTPAPTLARGERGKVALLPALGRRGAVPDHLAVYRVDPPHGYLGTAEIESDEESLRRRYGGRVLRVEARTAEGKKIPGGTRTLAIAADPVIPDDPLRAQRSITGATPSQLATEDRADLYRASAEERLQLLKAEIEERNLRERREMAERLERSKLEHAQALERMKLESRLESERAREAAKEMVALVQANSAAQLQMMQSFHGQSIEMLSRVHQAQAQHDPLGTLRAGIELAQSLGGGGGPDEAQSALGKLVDVAKEGLRTMREVPRLPPPRAPLGRSTGSGDATQGPGADKAQRVRDKLASTVRALEAQGYDLEEVLDGLSGSLAQAAAPAPAPAAAAPRAPAPPSAPAPAAVTPSLADFTDDE